MQLIHRGQSVPVDFFPKQSKFPLRYGIFFPFQVSYKHVFDIVFFDQSHGSLSACGFVEGLDVCGSGRDDVVGVVPEPFVDRPSQNCGQAGVGRNSGVVCVGIALRFQDDRLAGDITVYPADGLGV